MKKWNKSYTWAIIVVAAFVVMFIVFYWLDNRAFKFEGSEAIEEEMKDWDPVRAEKGEPHSIDGEILYYSLDCFKHYGSWKKYVGLEEAERGFIKSNVKTADDIGAIAVLYYQQAHAGTYQNGAGAYRDDCTAYILDPDTKKVLAQETLKGGSPSSTTSGGDRTGAAPNVASCKKLAEKLVAEMK